MDSFQNRWAEKELRLGMPDELRAEMIAFEGVLLPSEASPFLTFGDANGRKYIFDIFGAPEQWNTAERERLSDYIVIGADGSGNPICQRESDKAIVLVDHDDGFRTVEFVNSSVQQLQQSLLAYFGETDPDKFNSAMREIDANAIAKEAFWYFAAKEIGE